MTAEQGSPGLTGTVIRGVGFAGSGFILARGITLASYVVLARLVTPEELGQFAAGSVLVGIGLLFAGSGMAAAVIHRHEGIDRAASTAVVATTLAGILLALLSVAFAPLLGAFFSSGTVTEVAAVVAGVLLLQSARVIPNALLQRRFSFLRRLVVEPASALAFGAAAIIATSEGLGVWGLVIGLYASAVADFVLSWALVRWWPRFSMVSFETWRELVAYGRHVLAGSAVRRLGDRIPIAAAGGFVGTAALGQFQYANRLVSTPFAFLVAGVSYVVFPAFARISADNRRFQPAFLRSLRWMVLVAMPMGLLLIPLGEPLAILVFGERWAEAGQATAALAVFIPAQIVAQLSGEAFKGAGQPHERTRVNAVGVLAGILAMGALIPPFGLIGVAMAVSIDALASAASSLVRVHRVLAIPPRAMLTRIAAPLAAGVGMVVCLLPLELVVVDAAEHGTAAGLALLAGEALAGVAIYVVCVRILAPNVTEELAALLRSARRRPPASVTAASTETTALESAEAGPVV